MTYSTRASTLWRAFAAYGLWAVCFTMLYTGHALGCTWILTSDGHVSFSASAGTLTGALAALWLLFILWVLLLAVRSGARVRAFRRHHPEHSWRFMAVLTFITDASAVIVTVISGLPVVLTPACA